MASQPPPTLPCHQAGWTQQVETAATTTTPFYYQKVQKVSLHASPLTFSQTTCPTCFSRFSSNTSYCCCCSCRKSHVTSTYKLQHHFGMAHTLCLAYQSCHLLLCVSSSYQTLRGLDHLDSLYRIKQQHGVFQQGPTIGSIYKQQQHPSFCTLYTTSV